MKRYLILSIALFFPLFLHAEILPLKYDGFTVWLDCSRHGAVKFNYHVYKDNSNLPRHNKFYSDESVPARCRQTSTRGYRFK